MSAKSKPKSKPAANGPPVPVGDALTLAAAAFLRVSEDGLRKDADAGRVPGRVVAGEWRFGKAALLDWLGRPEPAGGLSGQTLVDHIRRTGMPWGEESAREAEAFIAKVYAARRADSLSQ